MAWFRNLKTRSKILTLAGIMAILMILIAFLSYRTANGLAESMEDLYDNYAAPAAMMSEADSAARMTRFLVAASLLQTDEKLTSAYPAQVEANRKIVASYIARYKETNITATEREMLTKIENLTAIVRPLQDQILQLGIRNDPDAGFTILESISDEEGELFDTYNKLTSYLMDLAEETKETASAEAATQIKISFVITVIALIIGVTLAFIVSLMITRPLLTLMSGIGEFAKGDLGVELASKNKDEIGDMGRALGNMSTVLNQVIGSVVKASYNISETAHEFSAMAEETNASVEEFRANIDEMGSNLDNLAASGEEVNASVQEVAAGAQATAEKGTDIARRVDEAISAGEKGMSAVHNVVDGIGKVAESSNNTASAVIELGNRARQIQSFVAQIGGIADQTNLLALNAAIEAARAGEAGRGFAVVAEEVRKLAEDSNVAAKNIAELAAMITSELDNIVKFSQENATDSSEAKTLSTETEDAISTMIKYLSEIANATQDLAAVAEEQAASSEEIAETIQGMSMKIGSTATASDNIRNSVIEVAAAAERVAQGAEGLSGLSTELQEELTYFKLAEDQKRQSASGGLRALPAKQANNRR